MWRPFASSRSRFRSTPGGQRRQAGRARRRGMGARGAKLAFTPSIAPAMWNDSDSTAAVDLLIDFLSQPGRTNASLITAAEDGIHWNAIRQAARLIDTVSRRSVHGQGNLNFAAIAMLKPYGPFYPGAYHPGGSRAFSIGVERSEEHTSELQ